MSSRNYRKTETTKDTENTKNLSGLPEGWSWVKLGNYIEKIPTTGKKLKQKDYLTEGKYKVVDQGKEMVGGYSNNRDLLLNCNLPVIVFGDHTKAKKYISFNFIPGADGVKVIKPFKEFDAKLFYYFLHVLHIPDKGYSRHFQYVEKSFLPLPPLPEQHRIVEKIEELFSELDNGIDNLKKAKAQIKIYRQAVLKFAFEGRLTTKDTQNTQKLSDLSVLSGLPKGWNKVKFNNFVKLQRGYDLPLKNIVQGEYPVITSSGIKGFHNEFKAEGPILVTGRSGSVGSTHYFEYKKYWPHNTVLFVKDFLGNYPKFIYYFFLQFNFKSFSASTAVPTLDRKQLYNEPIFQPPYDQQTQIVEEIERRFSVADKMEAAIDESLKKSEALRQSILKQAFEGKLVQNSAL
ncbi:MAG: restriction endonuclease subunit S [Melioribacteraceae bacterium]|nr:restriction endonuclease subunit S [Melioribacteraceae bacterium]